ncbi:hypothetical protein [Aeromonas hydrophila]|uniref:hypothetical protein n=1 Tax=Aeromonas hydrophila TaxID=644 RepID=UPI001F45271E|nr:hypothetical protein [Aeromonas hydrophila]
MDEWSVYFENSPEEKPTNWANGQLNLQLAEQIRDHEERLRGATNRTRTEINIVAITHGLKLK